MRITTRAKGLAWEAIKVDLFKVEQYDPNYLRLDPGVPTLVHHGKPLSSPPSSAKVARSGPCSLISENSVSEIPKIADELANIIAEVRLRLCAEFLCIRRAFDWPRFCSIIAK